jgi:hypothetical protein
MSFIAAIQILQLRQARDGDSGQKTGLVFDAEQSECMEELLPGLERCLRETLIANVS